MKRKRVEIEGSQDDHQTNSIKRFFMASTSGSKITKAIVATLEDITKEFIEESSSMAAMMSCANKELLVLEHTKQSKTSKQLSTPKSSSKWKWNKTLLYYDEEDVKPSDKIAAFDFDNTLVKTSLFKHGVDAWSILYPNCLEKLSSLHKDGFKLVIFTNQAGIGRAKSTREKIIAEKKGRLLGFVKKVGLPFQIFASTQKDNYYKPNPGMWNFMSKERNGGKDFDKTLSFFVGDAAGRKDHSDADKKFAENCGLIFYTEDEFFSVKK